MIITKRFFESKRKRKAREVAIRLSGWDDDTDMLVDIFFRDGRLRLYNRKDVERVSDCLKTYIPKIYFKIHNHYLWYEIVEVHP